MVDVALLSSSVAKTPAVGSVVKVLEEFRFLMNILCEDDPDHRRLGAETEE